MPASFADPCGGQPVDPELQKSPVGSLNQFLPSYVFD
jgi:hypothetical protein